MSEDRKNVTYSHSDSCESFKFIHFRGWATKSDGYFPYFFVLFTQRFVYWLYAVGWFSLFFSRPILIFCVSLVPTRVRIHCISAVKIASRVTYNWYVLLLWEQDGFVFLAFAESHIKIPLRVLSGSKRHNLSLVSVIFVSFSLPWWLYLYTISFHVDYIISQ